jgi:hypothetical protein
MLSEIDTIEDGHGMPCPCETVTGYGFGAAGCSVKY